jgi:antirestriction protein ArdC
MNPVTVGDMARTTTTKSKNNRPTYSPEERKARLETAHDEMTEAIKALGSGQEWQAFLAFASKLHKYSAQNRMWLYAQAISRGWDELGHVAGYRTWLSLGRNVRKGEKALKVLAPCRYKKTDEATGESTWVMRGFTVESVFAASQTEGEGEIPTNPARPQLLTGEAPEGAFEALKAIAESKGFTVTTGPTLPANGYTSWGELKVVIGEHLAPAAATKTMAHELAHVLLHGPGQVDYHDNRDRCEVEAESTAYLVCGELGLESDAYSFPYVAHWANGDTKVVTATADKALKTANDILALVAGEEVLSEAPQSAQEVTPELVAA